MSGLGTSWTAVSRHRRQAQARLVLPTGIEAELPEERVVLGHDRDLVVGNKPPTDLPGPMRRCRLR
jgi:hypothetical protein